MIYILCKDRSYISDQDSNDDAIIMASNKIDDLLEYLNAKNTSNYFYLESHDILIREEGHEYGDEIFVSTKMIDHFIYFRHSCYDDHKEELEEIKEKVSAWCSKVQKEIAEIKEKQQKENEARKEANERALYEQLKAKYERK